MAPEIFRVNWATECCRHHRIWVSLFPPLLSGFGFGTGGGGRGVGAWEGFGPPGGGLARATRKGPGFGTHEDAARLTGHARRLSRAGLLSNDRSCRGCVHSIRAHGS